jgi:ectoine hydroxylase-related dioxygenase (phytanoyl-CoA dioxygenase family)
MPTTMNPTPPAAKLCPVTSLERALKDLEEHGACIIKEALSPELLEDVRVATYRCARNDRRYGWAEAYQYGRDDHINQRIWNLPSRDPVFCELAEHPLAIEFVKQTLGWPASLSSMSANITNGGGGSMVVHTDQGYLPGPLTRPWVFDLAWCIDDFTPENGATLIAPGSHRSDALPSEEAKQRMIPAVAPAGSLLVLDGRTWHTNGVNTAGTSRAGIFAVYTVPYLLPQENWPLSLNPAVRQFGSETLQTLFGFRPQILGRVNGRERI